MKKSRGIIQKHNPESLKNLVNLSRRGTFGNPVPPGAEEFCICLRNHVVEWRSFTSCSGRGTVILFFLPLGDVSEKSPVTVTKGVENDTNVEWRNVSGKSPGTITRGVKTDPIVGWRNVSEKSSGIITKGKIYIYTIVRRIMTMPEKSFFLSRAFLHPAQVRKKIKQCYKIPPYLWVEWAALLNHDCYVLRSSSIGITDGKTPRRRKAWLF